MKYAQLRQGTFRLLNKINACGGSVFYTGIEKTAAPEDHSPNPMMFAILRTAIRKLDQYCVEKDAGFIMFLDHHDDAVLRDALVTVPQQEMYGANPVRTLLEAPTQIESHRYQLMQAADWMCGLIGRVEAYRTRPDEYPDYNWTEKYFTHRLNRVTVRSGVRKQTKTFVPNMEASEVSLLNE